MNPYKIQYGVFLTLINFSFFALSVINCKNENETYKIVEILSTFCNPHSIIDLSWMKKRKKKIKIKNEGKCKANKQAIL